MGSVEVVVPWRGGCPHRHAALDWVTARLADMGLKVTVGEHVDGEWSKARAVHAAGATADVLVIHDADVWCDGLDASIAAVQAGASWAIPHREVRRLDAASTSAVLGGGPLKGRLAERIHGGHAGGGITVLPRSVYESCPLDPRFEGWGQEDDSWAIALEAIRGPHRRGLPPLWHLWHPPSPRLTRAVGSDRGRALHDRYRAARRDLAAITALVAEARTALEGVEA